MAKPPYLYRKGRPEEVKSGDQFYHLGLLWQVKRVTKSEPKTFMAITIFSNGMAKQSMVLDVALAPELKWLANRRFN